MRDQADKLRQLVRDAMPSSCEPASLPPTILVTGAKGGVGTTTVALNLAVALSHRGFRIALVDAAPHPDAAQLADVDTSYGPCLMDVLTGDAMASQALRPGPAGVLLLARRLDAAMPAGWTERAMERLLQPMQSMQHDTDVLVVDAGSGLSAATRRLWPHAALVLIVSTPDDVAVLDAYAIIKVAGRQNWTGDARVVLNQCDSRRVAVDVHRRLAATCRRFLGCKLPPAPHLPSDPAGTLAGVRAIRAWERPNSAYARSLSQLARFVADVLARHSSSAALVRAVDDNQPILENCSC